MPFLRFNRDRRGYETTALMHAFRERGRTQAPRILYWFRGPVAVKMGRPAIDEQAIRLIEERHPELTFDWPKILESRAVARAEAASAERERPRREPARQQPARPDADLAEAARQEPVVQGLAADGQKAARRRPRRRGRGGSERTALSDAETPAARATEAAELSLETAAEEMFSPEDLTRLRGRHAALLARIDRAVADGDAAQALRHEAEALNPDTWVTREDVARALEHYESTYRQLLDALGPRQRVSGT